MVNVAEILYNSFKPKEPRQGNGQVTFAPSYLSDCARKIYYSKTGTSQSNPADLPSLLKMSWGNILHDDMQTRLNNAGVLESFEEWKEIEYQGLKFIYRYDGILKADKRYILEIKTVYASGYKSIEESPKDEHVIQAISYMIFEGINDAVIIYAGRDNGYLKQHTIELNGWAKVNGKDTNLVDRWEAYIEKLHKLKRQIESKQLPDRDFKIVLKNSNGVITDEFQKDNVKYKSDWQCSYCGFKDLCWQKEYEQIKNHQFFINGEFK